MCAHFSISKQCQISCCYTYGLLSAGAAQGELPEVQALGYDLSAPFLTICKRLTVGAAIGRPRSTLPSHSFSILHFQFSILHTPNSNKQQKRAVSRPLFCIPKHQHAPFSEQNLTSLPSRIIFVVRTAHILPHIEQV